MTRSLMRMALAEPGDVVAARQLARSIAELLGLDMRTRTRFATAVSEIARNAVLHAGRGAVEFAVDAPERPGHLLATVTDAGPGITDLDDVLGGRRPMPPGRGAGLLSARRLVDRFDIASSARGTTVRLEQQIARSAAVTLSSRALDGVCERLQPRRIDPVQATQEHDREIIDSLAELHERQAEAERLNRELEETNRGVVALYSELDQRAEQLRGASDMKSRFLSHMSHEFRTPLNSILALSRLLIDGVDGPLNDEQGRQVEYIRRCANGLLEMVNDLLDLSKVEAGKVDIRPVEIRIDNLFAALRGSLRPLLANPLVELTFDMPQGLPELYADEQKVVQILRNLISNALKFTERGRVHVDVRHDAAAGQVVFRVEDTGIGIAPEHQQRVFDEFEQVDSQLQRGGTGLGLPLSRRLAQLLGGELTLVSSAPAMGSRFELVLPLRFGAGSAHPVQEADGAMPRLLVVDDEEAFRYVIRHIAEDAGFEVFDAGDGREGLDAARQHAPDVVILDLQMPRMNGFEMLDAFMRSAQRRVPVIVCTSQALNVDQKRALAAAHAIVPKQDISRDGLSALIHSVMPARSSPA